MSRADQYDATIDLLSKPDVWVQGCPEFGHHCLITALSVTFGSGNKISQCPELYKKKEGFSLVNWNDEPGRTLDDVLDLLRRGRDAARMKENQK